ncbi:MAG: GTPase ObgE [Bacilli bacterium]
MFVDEVIMTVEAGSGGNGCMAYRREKYIPMGGPYGGSGGKGSDIIFKADPGLHTLIDLRYQKRIKGNNGSNGEGKNKNGSNSDDIKVKVPIGTTIKDADTGVIIADLTKVGEEATIAYGGRGGRGNVSLATRSNPCPSYAEKGEPGEVRNIKVELRMMADVGLVGMPSVGKSTILSMISNANPKIASYHFTTLSPNLGVVKTEDNDFVVADLPGLIEGASSGVGLGHKFLKHIERTKIIAHVIDMAGEEGRNPYDDYIKIRKELEEFSPKLLMKPEIIIANKMDGVKAKNNLKEFRKKVNNKDIFEVTALVNEGLDKVINKLSDMTKSLEREDLYEENIQESHVLYKFKKEKAFNIINDNDTYIIKGDTVEKLFRMTNFNTEEAYEHFSNRLRKLGVDEELEKMGIKEGDTVKILDFEFEWTR